MNKEKISENKDLSFPSDFLWGTATSAHQIEGNNAKNDWWQWEKSGKVPCSGKAADHYHKFEEDFDLVKSMVNNAHRLSIEWSRIEPKEGQWDYEEVRHYKKVLKALGERDLKIMLTLHHFTNPLWFSQKGGWENKNAAKIFARYVRFIARELGDKVDFWITINEPMIYAMQSYLKGIFPPGKKSKILFRRVVNNLVKAHKLAYQAIHQELDKKKDKVQIGIAKNVALFSPWPKKTFFNQIIISIIDRLWNHWFFKKTKGTHDFIGLNFYFHFRLKISPFGYQIIDAEKIGKEVSQTGWEIDPEAFSKMVLEFRKYNLPIYITENGIATRNEDQRTKYLIPHLKKLLQSIQKGADVRGYFYWSLLDNFEWEKGFKPRFGLFKNDFQIQKRTITPAGKIYGKIAKENAINSELLEKEIKDD